MRIAEKILNVANSLISFVEIVVLCIIGLYAVFALWDNHQVYAAAENVQEELMRLKPSEGGDKASFEKLMKINPDVCAWLTVDNTNIDYPVLQGQDNLSYINTDVYGEFALAGSIFLDTRCDRNFQDDYSVLYGHYMSGGEMFGDLELFKDQKFFEENMTGTLLLPTESYDLKIFACMLVSASDEVIYEPEKTNENMAGLMNYARRNALFVREDMLNELSSALEESTAQIVALTTCSYEYTDARTVVLAAMYPKGITE